MLRTPQHRRKNPRRHRRIERLRTAGGVAGNGEPMRWVSGPSTTGLMPRPSLQSRKSEGSVHLIWRGALTRHCAHFVVGVPLQQPGVESICLDVVELHGQHCQQDGIGAFWLSPQFVEVN